MPQIKQLLQKVPLWPRHDLKKGILLVSIGWFLVSVLYMLTKLAGDRTNLPTILFFRSLTGVLIALPWVIKSYPKRLILKRPKLVVTRALLGFLNIVFVVLAIQKISLVNTTLLNNTAPFFVPIIAWFWLKVPLNHKIWPAAILGFLGIAIILQPDKRLFDLGAMYAILSGMCLAITLLILRLSSKAENFLTYMLYFFGIGLIISTPFALINWRIDGIGTFFSLIGISLCAAVGQIFLFYGHKQAQARFLAPFIYTTVIFSGFFEWLIWGVLPHPMTYIGMALIIGSGIWIYLVGKASIK